MIVERIYKYSKSQPLKAVIIINERPVSYRDFALYIEFLRKNWLNHDLPAGSVAIVVCRNRLIGWAATLALQSLGLITVAADSIAGLTKLGLSHVSCIFTVNIKLDDENTAVAQWPNAVKLELPRSKQGFPVPENFISTPGGGHILYTSGTTGAYKKIFHDAALDQIRYEARSAVSKTVNANVTNITFYGPWTAIGFRQPTFLWMSGATVVFDDRPDWHKHLGAHGVTHVSMTPGALQKAVDVLGQGGLKSAPIWAFELSIGGGVTSASLIRRVHKIITPFLTPGFGCTEMFLPVMRTTAQEHDDDFWLKPMGVREIDIVDENGVSCPDMVEGCLRIRVQPTDYSSYMGDPVTTSQVFREGWFYPGDMAVRRADGRIRVLGRTADVINIRGNKLASAAIEEAVRSALGANAVCAFSGLMADNEDHIVFVVEPSTPIAKNSYQQLAVELRKKMGTVRFVEMNAFPRTSTGTLKIDRVALRKLVMNRNPVQI